MLQQTCQLYSCGQNTDGASSFCLCSVVGTSRSTGLTLSTVRVLLAVVAVNTITPGVPKSADAQPSKFFQRVGSLERNITASISNLKVCSAEKHTLRRCHVRNRAVKSAQITLGSAGVLSPL